MTIKFVSNSSANASSFNEYEEIGNEYNIQLPAHGTVIIDYIPDGRYEMTCHYDIDFDNYNVTMTNGTVEFEKKNDKWYITISSKPETSTGDFLHAATVDYWRGYVDDENKIISSKTAIKESIKNSWLGGNNNGFNVKENYDEKYLYPEDSDETKEEDLPSENVIWEDYLAPGYQSGN